MVSRRRDSLDNRLGNENARFSSTPRVQGPGQEDGASTVRLIQKGIRVWRLPSRFGSRFSESTGSEYSRMRSRKMRKKVIVGVVAAVVALAVIGVGAALQHGRSEWQAVEGHRRRSNLP